jgi:hypothetical protein
MDPLHEHRVRVLRLGGRIGRSPFLLWLASRAFARLDIDGDGDGQNQLERPRRPRDYRAGGYPNDFDCGYQLWDTREPRERQHLYSQAYPSRRVRPGVDACWCSTLPACDRHYEASVSS